MSIAIGSSLGSFEITTLLGKGGMGEVYRARDPKLKRDVAIKTLPDEFSRDADRVGRFQREAEALAALNHANIAAIYDVQESNGIRFLVLELVDGETLSERIARGPIPLDETLHFARQLVAGLEAAHERGVIHRDLKPANIKITPEGGVKVLDFGLAKALQEQQPSGQSNSPTFMSAISAPGVIIGTAAYMSPEQARGRVVDKRTDIWAFGCVLFEMLSGVNPFSGETVTDMVAAVVQREPDWNLLPATTPRQLKLLIQRCLNKDAKQRLRDIGDARFDLSDAEPAAEKKTNSTRGALVFGAVAVLLASLAFFAGSRLRGNTASSELTRMSVVIPEGHRVVSGPAITRDGKRIAFASTDGIHPRLLYTRKLDSFELRALPGTEQAHDPFFSPDGRWVAYFDNRQLFKLDLEANAAPVSIASASTEFGGGTWGDDGTIVFTPTWNGGLYRVAASGGKAELLIAPDPAKKEYAYTWPQFMANGKELLFASWGPFNINRLILADKTQTVVARGFWTSPIPSPTGHLIIGNQNGDVQALRSAANAGASSPVTVLQNVDWNGTSGSGRFAFALSSTGTLVYAPANITKKSLVVVDETGQSKPALQEEHPYSGLSLSPDGRRVAVVYDGRLWVIDLERGGRTRIGENMKGAEGRPVWNINGSKIYFASNVEGNWNIYSRSASGSGAIEPILQQEGDQVPKSVAPDGTLAYTEPRPKNGEDIRFLSADGKNTPWLATTANEDRPAFSPDGRWIAYESDATGRTEVYLQPVSGTGERIQVSTDGGQMARWSPKGDVLFYRQANAMMASDIQTSGRLSAGKPRLLFDGGWQLPSDVLFSVMPDGKHFLMVKFDAAAIPTRIDVVFNWLEELKKKLP